MLSGFSSRFVSKVQHKNAENISTKLKSDGCKICNSSTTVMCINCNVKIYVDHWDRHKACMKGITLRDVLREVHTAHDGLDLKTSLSLCLKDFLRSRQTVIRHHSRESSSLSLLFA